jgi:hypothetical protein
MRGAARRRAEPNEIVHVVLDDATVERLRLAAAERHVEVEQLIVHVLHSASWQLDKLLLDPPQ